TAPAGLSSPSPPITRSPLHRSTLVPYTTLFRSVVLHMIRMARVGVDIFENLKDPESFVKAVHVTGDLENLGQGTPDDKRYFVTRSEEHTSELQSREHLVCRLLLEKKKASHKRVV